MKKILQRVWACVLCLCLLSGLIPPTQAADATAGSFYFTVMTANNTVVEPVAVPYSADQSVWDALSAAGYDMLSTEDGTVTSINGVEASYLRYYDDGGYDMAVPASSIQAMLFSVNDVYSEEMLDLVCSMGAYNEATNHVQNDPAAKAAYDAALVQMRAADAQTAKNLNDTLTAAVAAYEARLNGSKYTVSFRVTQAGSAFNNAAVRLTDAYGNVTEGIGSAAVVAGEYTYCITDGGHNRTEGKLTVSSNCTVDVTLPYGNWFGDIMVLSGDHLDDEENKIAYQAVRDDHQVTWYVDDDADGESLYLYAEQGSVPDKTKTRLHALYTGTDGFDYSASYRSWSSTTVKLPNLVDAGMVGRTFTLEARCISGDVTQYQTLDVQIIRVPTLRSLSLQQADAPLYLPFDPMVTEYTLRATQDTVTIDAVPFTEAGTTVKINGTDTTVVTLTEGVNQVTLQVSHTNGQSRTYRLNIEKTDAAAVTVNAPQGVTAQICYPNGAVIEPEENGSYILIPGDTYMCRSTVGTCYHAVQEFIAAEGLVVQAARPDTTDHLSNVAFYDRSAAAIRKAYSLDQAFDASVHSYTMPVLDTTGSLYVQATEAAPDITATVNYLSQSATAAKCGVNTRILIAHDVSDTGNVTYLSAALAASGYTQYFTVRTERTVGDVTHYQEYLFTAPKTLHLSDLGGTVDGEKMELLDAGGEVIEFGRTQLTYYVQVLRTAQSLSLSGIFPNENAESPIGGGYYAMVNGQRYDSVKDITVNLAQIEDGGMVKIQVCHEDSQAVSQTYTLYVNKVEPVAVRYKVTPAEAMVFVINNKNGSPVYAQADGSFLLVPGNSYTYNITARGYTSYSNPRYTAPEQGKTVKVTLKQATGNTELPDYTAEWPSFRQNSDNNGVMNAASPIKAEDAVLYWAQKIGLGWYGDACGCPILVDDHIYIYAGEKIYKLDKTNGAVVAEGDMDHSSNFSITNATYGDGMIFVGLSNGTVQAFNAETLESLWFYEDALGGQPNCPIAYYDGYLYTGFWRSETADANFVCLSVTDEDPLKPMEKKIASWTYTAPGGFYWSGANVNEDYVLVGTDDGQTGNAKGFASLVCLDVRTGAVLSAIKLPHTGDVRCSITYDKTSDAYYFTTKGGYFYKVSVDAAGQIDSDSLRYIQLHNGSGKPAGSSSSPTIYNGRAYIGVSGTGAYGPYTGHNISVIDLDNWEIAYSVPTQGNPQTSGVLTTAYDKGDGTVYIYFLDNFTPGKLRVIRDRAGQSEPMDLVTEVYKEASYSVAPALFTPYDAQTQYAICSPIVDSDGTLYFKNDSGYLMAVGTKVSKLELTAAPTKTSYCAGEKFDPTGMQVTATYANGTTRDVTNAVVWNEDPLTAQDTNFELVLPMCYQNGTDGKAGVPVESPIVSLSLEITEVAEPMEMPFVDVPDGAFYFDPVLWAASKEITTGVSANKFAPDLACSRAQVVTFLWRAAGSPEPGNAKNPFVDVSPSAYYYKATLWAVKEGITTGVSAVKFAPDAPCLRSQVVTFLWRAADEPAPHTAKCQFTDVQSNDFYYNAMLWAVGEEITNGTSATTFAPSNTCTRGQIVTFLYRFLG